MNGRGGKSGKQPPLRPARSKISNGVHSQVPCPPGAETRLYRTLPPYPGGRHQPHQAHQSREGLSHPRSKTRTANCFWFLLVFPVLVVAFILYDPPTELDDHSGASQKEGRRWEWAREDRVPQGAFWDPLWPANDCRAYGKREYWAALRNIPEDWTDMEACMNMPVEIKDFSIRRPDRCGYVEGSSHILGFWMVDWDQVDCKPWHVDVTDQGCTNHGSGTRRIEAVVMGINDKPEQDWRLLCESTPFTWQHITYHSPTHCRADNFGKKYAMWDVPDLSC